MKPNWTPIKIKLGNIICWEHNPRLSNKAQAKRLIESEKHWGQPMTFAVSPFDENGKVQLFDGHQRYSAWITVYGEDYEVDARQCDRFLTEEERLEFVVTMHAGATGSWDWQKLSSFPAPKLIEMGFDEDLKKQYDFDANNIKELLNSEQPEEPPTDPRKTLAERFGVPPFSVLNARGGLWQDRKRAWISLGIQSELGRGDSPSTSARSDEASYRTIRRQPNATPSGSLRGAMTLENGRIVRGDGKGHKFAGALKDSEEYPDTLARKRMYDNKDNGLLGISQQARSHYKEATAKDFGSGGAGELSASFKSQSRQTALQKSNGARAIHGHEWQNEVLGGTQSPQTGTSIFDPVLCELAYRWFMPQDSGKILDPFAGGSVRGVVASLLGKDYTGIDLSARQIEANEQQGRDLCKDKQPRWINGDSLKIKELAAGEYDFVFSCPPYGDLEVYSDDPADLSRMNYADFIKAYREIIAQCVSMLKENRFACFVVGDIRDSRGFYRNFPAHTIDAFQDAGMILYNEAILVTAIGSLPIRVSRQFDGGRKLGKTHQNVLVFYKGNPKAIKDFGAVEFGEVEELQGADEIPD